MKEKKLQIFISSTYKDLLEERQAAVEAILSSGHIPAGMELFAAGDESQITVIERWIDDSDIFLLILGGRYGSIDPKTKKSYIQLEFEYALSKNIPFFAVVISEDALKEKVKNFGIDAIEQDNQRELKRFRSIVLKKLVKIWDDKKDIKLAIHETISDFYYRKEELVGWIRGNNSIDTGLLAEEMARLTKENSELRMQLNNLNNIDNTKYAGLSYHELKDLLVKEKIEIDSKEANIFQFFIANGENFSNGIYVKPASKYIVSKLVMHKVLECYGYDNNMYKFTEDGHNFYLKTLSLKSKLE